MIIDWKLYDDEEILIETLENKVEFINDTIFYKDEYGTHAIDLINKTYERKNNEDTFKIDFKTEQLQVSFANTDLKYNINATFEEMDNIIRLTYSLGDEKKVIEITRKEEK